MHFSVAVMLCDMEIQSTSSPINFGSQCCLLAVAIGQFSIVYQFFQHVQRTFFSDTIGPVSIILHTCICSIQAYGKSLNFWSGSYDQAGHRGCIC